MTMLLLLLGHALASGLPHWPQAGATVSGECVKTFGLTAGQSIDPLLIDTDALARCSAVVEPLSSYAHLLAIESHAIEVRELYALDVARLTDERDYWRSLAGKDTRWHRQPWFVAVTVSALAAAVFMTYDLSGEQR